MPYAKISAIGSWIPEKRLTNAELCEMVETSDEWIVKRTGIRERRIARKDEYTSHMCEKAVEDMMIRYGKTVEDVDMIIVCTHTPDFPFPSVSCLLQERLGVQNPGAIDLNATCAGFSYGLHVAHGLIASGLHRKILVLAGDTMSKITDYTDRSSCILFGDGAGAALVEASPDQNSFIAHDTGSDGSGAIHGYRTGLARRLNGVELSDTGCFVQNGREVYRWAVSTVPPNMKKLAEKAGMDLADVDWFVPHSANLRMIESICEKSGFPLEKTLHSVESCGNTSGASIPLSLDAGVRQGKVKNGETVLLYGFGAGLVYAGLIVRLFTGD